MEAGDLYAVAAEIQALTFTIFRAAKKDLEHRLESQAVHVGALQYHVLRLLRDSHYTLSELSRELSHRPASLVPVIDALEQHGLVVRGHDPRDRRRIPLTLTPLGAQIVDLVPALDSGDSLCRGLCVLGDAKCRDLLVLLRELAGQLENGEDRAEGPVSSAPLGGGTAR